MCRSQITQKRYLILLALLALTGINDPYAAPVSLAVNSWEATEFAAWKVGTNSPEVAVARDGTTSAAQGLFTASFENQPSGNDSPEAFSRERIELLESVSGPGPGDADTDEDSLYMEGVGRLRVSNGPADFTGVEASTLSTRDRESSQERRSRSISLVLPGVLLLLLAAIVAWRYLSVRSN